MKSKETELSKDFLEMVEDLDGGDPEISPQACYRLLDVDDKIRGTDEFLEDDGKSWLRIDWNHSRNIGQYWHTALKPMRRILEQN